MKVAELFAAFEIKTNKRSVNDALNTVRYLRNNLLAVGSVMGAGSLIKGMIGFNARVEDAKNNIAAMLGLATKTSMHDNLAKASTLYDQIREKASELPGTTEDYVQAMAKLTLPIMSAGGSLEELKDLTVATIVAAKGGVGGATPKTAVTDVLQGIEGRFSTTDFFLKALLEPLDNGKYVGEAGRKLFKSLTKQMRYREIMRGLQNPVFQELGDAQGKSFTGQMDKAKENFAQFLGRVGKPIFDVLTKQLTDVNAWLTKNKEKVDAFADSIGKGLLAVFTALGDAAKWLYRNWDEVKDILTVIAIIIGGVMVKATAAWAVTWMPIFFTVYALVKIFKFLQERIGTTGTVVVMLAGAFALLKGRAILGALAAIAQRIWGIQIATVAANRATAASAFLNGGGALTLGGAGSNAATMASSAAAARAARVATAAKVAKGAGLIGLLQAATPDTGSKTLDDQFIEKADFVGGDRVSKSGQLLEQAGEWNLERAMMDVQEVAKGRFLGAAFGRGATEGQLRGSGKFNEVGVQKVLADQAAARNQFLGTQIDASMTIHVQGGLNMDEPTLRRVIGEANDQERKHLMEAFGGGTP